MQQLVALVLVELQVAGRVKRDVSGVAPVRPDPQRDLLTHRATRHKDGRRLAEQRGDLLLEGRDQRALPITIRRGIWRRVLRQVDEGLPRRPRIVMRQEPCTGRKNGVYLVRTSSVHAQNTLSDAAAARSVVAGVAHR
jgi:hypothetical protein